MIKKTKAKKIPPKFTTAQITPENLAFAKSLCPEGRVFSHWFNQFLRQSLEVKKYSLNREIGGE